MAFDITSPERMNRAFAEAFNSGDIGNLLGLYEPDALLRTAAADQSLMGIDAIKTELAQLIQLPGRMESHNRFCMVHGDLALLRADWELRSDDGTVVASGSSAELVRKQADGRWLYVIDHAVGASLPRALLNGATK